MVPTSQSRVRRLAEVRDVEGDGQRADPGEHGNGTGAPHQQQKLVDKKRDEQNVQNGSGGQVRRVSGQVRELRHGLLSMAFRRMALAVRGFGTLFIVKQGSSESSVPHDRNACYRMT